MHYADGADAGTDRPAFVRAASSMAWLGDRIAMVQDDVNFVALVDPTTGLADAITLPAGKDDLRQFDDGRGNKKYKFDFEAMARVPTPGGTTLLAFGSGSKKRRENVLVLQVSGPASESRAHVPQIVPLPELYATLRAAGEFSGSDMNIEGAVYVDGMIRLFGRGNGASRGDVVPLDATCDIGWSALRAHIDRRDAASVPSLSRITQYDLGAIDGVRLGFTDAIPLSRTTLLYSAAAEASEDARNDGAVVGSAIGIMPHDRRREGRWAGLLDEEGRPFGGKVEGLVRHRHDPSRALVVIDVDDHTRPSELCDVALSGPWFGA